MAWHALILIAGLLILAVLFLDEKMVKYWFFADHRISDEKISTFLNFFKFVMIVLSGGCLVFWFLRKVIAGDWRKIIVRWREIPYRVDVSAIIPASPSPHLTKSLSLLLLIWMVGVAISLIPGNETLAAILTEESGFLETLTVLFYLFSGIVSLKLVFPLFGRDAKGGLLRWWLLGLTIGCLFIAAEEINWGELYLHFEAGDFIRKVNCQNDVSLHNVPLPFIGAYWANDLAQAISICAGVLLPLLIWVSKFFRRLVLALEIPLPPWLSQAYFAVAAFIPQDNVIKLKSANIPSELREVTISIGVAIWLLFMMKNRRKVSLLYGDLNCAGN